MRQRSHSRHSSLSLVCSISFSSLFRFSWARLLSTSLALSPPLLQLSRSLPLLLAAILPSVRLCIMSAPAVASTNIPHSIEALLSVCGVPLQSWRHELQRLEQR